MALAGPCANHLQLASDRQPRQQLITHFFMSRILSLMANQQCQGIESDDLYSEKQVLMIALS